MAVTHIRGLEETMRTLRKIDPEIDKQQKKRIRRDLQPIVDDARKATPKQTPLSGWKKQQGAGTQRGAGGFPAWKGDAQRGIRTQIRKSRPKAGGRRIVLRVVQNSASGQIFDYAGKATPGNPIDRGLNSAGWGRSMRALWPAAERNMTSVVKNVQQSVADMEDIINRELKIRGASRRGI